MRYDLTQLQTCEQIDQFLAEYFQSLTHKSFDEGWDHDPMRVQELHALEWLYAQYEHWDDQDLVDFVDRYDATHPDVWYVYYAWQTTSPDVRKTTLRQVLYDAVHFND